MRMDGGCHCGRVRFCVRPEDLEVLDCNCSVCTKKGFLHLIVPPDRFDLIQGAEVLSTYTFGTHLAKHTFCRICGIHPFYTPRSHPDQVDVNARCLDGDALARFQVIPFDGRNWEDNVASIQDVQD